MNTDVLMINAPKKVLTAKVPRLGAEKDDMA
jgi:hypothetical protein